MIAPSSPRDHQLRSVQQKARPKTGTGREALANRHQPSVSRISFSMTKSSIT
ncbi:hypothetical protein SAMN05216312_11153 [Cohnella sp. OV330]|nr:hypothetical protein SAMN05216312_11153 [Cohnella sp. OV330]